jgi:aspartyl-tRNA(Asn)/glutamyl-tRNA(Gln) amidotransferase subunit B
LAIAGERRATGRPGCAHCRQHHLQQHRQESVRRALERRRNETADEIIEKQGFEADHRYRRHRGADRRVLAANAAMVAEFRAGKEKAFNALVGQAMKATKGKANPQQVNELLRKKLG